MELVLTDSTSGRSLSSGPIAGASFATTEEARAAMAAITEIDFILNQLNDWRTKVRRRYQE